MKTGQEGDQQEREQCAYNTGRPLAGRFRKHRHNLKEGFLGLKINSNFI
jgi:hypothetical protein